jgi:hypothetical protein
MDDEFYTDLYRSIDKNILFEGPAVDPVVIETRRSNCLKSCMPDILDGMEVVSDPEIDEMETEDQLVIETHVVHNGEFLTLFLTHVIFEMSCSATYTSPSAPFITVDL